MVFKDGGGRGSLLGHSDPGGGRHRRHQKGGPGRCEDLYGGMLGQDAEGERCQARGGLKRFSKGRFEVYRLGMRLNTQRA